MKIRHLKDSGALLTNNVNMYYEMQRDQFLKIFFDIGEELEWVNEDEKADICVYSVQLEDDIILRENEKNIFFSVENLQYWSYRGHYKFFNKYKWDDSKKTNIYIHNDTDRIIEKENHIIFPTVYFRIDYFDRIKSKYDLNVPWEKRRFCLFISQNLLNSNKEKMVNELAKLGPVNHINDFQMLLRNKSCYNSNDLLRVLCFFKFVICCENSKTKGYVTEKIFNILLAKSIPIYDGAPDIERYINDRRFLKYDDKLVENVKLLMNNKEKYEVFVNEPCININFDDENFKEKFNNKIKLKKVKKS